MSCQQPKLVGGFDPSAKILVKLDHFPNFRDENNKYLKPPPRKTRNSIQMKGLEHLSSHFHEV